MAKQSGLGDNLYIDGYDLSGDIGSLGGLSGTSEVIEVTGINKDAFERLLGVRSGELKYTAFFNPATDQAHERLSLLPLTNQISTYCRGTTLGKPAANLVAKQINYDPKRSDKGELTCEVQALSTGTSLEWGEQLTAGKITHASATAGTALDFGAASSFGLAAYLHVFSIGSGTATVKIQESSDNAGDTYADVTGGGFTAVTAIGTQRIQTATNLAVERYLKVTTTGTFTDLEFSVNVVRFLTAVE